MKSFYESPKFKVHVSKLVGKFMTPSVIFKCFVACETHFAI